VNVERCDIDGCDREAAYVFVIESGLHAWDVRLRRCLRHALEDEQIIRSLGKPQLRLESSTPWTPGS
jgi:hypothetical protein